MKKSTRIISLLLSLVLLSSMLVGCTTDELSLLKAISKSNNITSMESKTEVSLGLSAEGLSAKDKANFDQVVAMLNGSKLVINQKTCGSADKTTAKSQVDASMDLGGMVFGASAWVDMDVSGTNNKFKEIIKFPSIVSSILPAEFKGKQYMVLDLNDISKAGGTGNIDFKKLLAFSNDLTPKTIQFVEDYAAQFDPGFAIITRSADKTVNGQTVSVYNLKLDDTSFKKLLAYSVPNFLKNDKAMAFVKELILSSIEVGSVPNASNAKVKEEIEKSFAASKTDITEFLGYWDKAMNILKDVKMLGDKGINIEYQVNSDGYIVATYGNIDLYFDVNAYSNAFEAINALDKKNDKTPKKPATTNKGVFKISLDIKSEISNINKDIVVNIPTVSSSTSFGFTDLIKAFTQPTVTQPTVKKDTIAPKAPTVNKITRTAKKITGKAEIGSTVIVKKGKVVLGRAVANSKGVFSITIKPVKVKCTLLVTATDKSGNVSKTTSVAVK